MLDTLSLIGPTVRKAFAAVVLTPLVFIIGVSLKLSGPEAFLGVLGLWLGMLFPDLDVVTGWIRTTFQTMLLILFLAAGIMLYPIGWGIIGGYCPSGLIHGISTQLDPLVVCKLGYALLIGLAAYLLAWLAVSWVPAKNSFHHWTTAVFIAGGMGLLNQAVAISENPWPLTIGFAIGYGLHILLDGKKSPEGETILPPLPKNAAPIMKYLRF